MAAGIVKELDSSNRSYYKVDDIVKLLDVSQSKAYNMIREMRQECIDSGKLNVWLYLSGMWMLSGSGRKM